jgi:hypothetical protein
MTDDRRPRPGVPVPTVEWLGRRFNEKGYFSRSNMEEAAAWGYEQAIPEREKLINLLCESAKIADSYRNIPSPEYGMLSLGVHAMQCRAAAARLRGGGE